MAATVLTHTTRISWASGSGGTTVSGTVTRTGDGENNRLIALTASETNKLVNFVATVANIKMLVMLSDQDVTVKTNNSGSPADTINLKAGVPLFYADSANLTNPLTVNVTALYLTNTSSTEAALVDIKVLLDTTP